MERYMENATPNEIMERAAAIAGENIELQRELSYLRGRLKEARYCANYYRGKYQAALADAGDSWERLDAEVGFMDTLQAHRRGVLAEYARRGGKVRDLYTFGTHVEGNT